MSLTAVQLHVRDLLDGLTNPSLQQQNLQPAAAFVAPPVIYPESASSPAIYVWGGHGKDARRTAPRASLAQAQQVTLPVTSAGLRRVIWQVDVWLLWIAPSTPDDLSFPLLIDAVRKQLASAPMPVLLQDAQTGDQTQLVALAEEMEVQYATPEATSDQRNLLYSAAITVTAEEYYQL